jgi:hypothetical protein
MNVGGEVAYRSSAEFTLSCMNRSTRLVSGLLWNTANQGGLTYHFDNSFVVLRNKVCSIV